jgi:hypothetical protein
VGLADRAARLAEGDAVEPQEQPGQQAENENDRQQWDAREGRAHDQELAHENTERRQSGDGHDAEHQSPAEHRMGFGESAHVSDPLRAFDSGNVTNGEKDR